jgi:hypothetical protein
MNYKMNPRHPRIPILTRYYHHNGALIATGFGDDFRFAVRFATLASLLGIGFIGG